MSRRPSFTEARRRRLALHLAQVEVCEARSMITESLGIMMLGIGMPAALKASQPREEAGPVRRPAEARGGRGPRDATTIRILDGSTATQSRPARAEADTTARTVARPVSKASAQAGDWLTLRRPEAEAARPKRLPTSSTPSSQAGGTASGGRGVGASSAAPIQAFRIPAPAPTPDPSATAMIVGASSTASPGVAVAAARGATRTDAHPAPPVAPASSVAIVPLAFPPGGGASGGLAEVDDGLFTPTGVGGAAMLTFANFPLYTLDYNDGTVFFPGTYQLATLNSPVDLRAQVRDATVASYSWNTSNLTDATGISGTSTSKLTFKWKTSQSIPGGHDNSVTLTVTDSNSHTEVQTYWFRVPAGSVPSGGGPTAPTWPSTLAPDLVRPDSPAFDSHHASVIAVTGALETAIGLPGYSPVIAGLALEYDSLAADPLPLINVHHALNPSLALPSRVDAKLTYNGSVVGTTYYDATDLVVGDILQMAVQADATAISTGRYSYSVDVADVRTTTTTTTYSGTTTVLSPTDANSPSTALGQGWSLAGLHRLISATGGLILDVGRGNSLWFTAVGGGTSYTSPKGDFSTLAPVGGGGYTRTLTDGTVYNFNSNGYLTSTVDRGGRATAYAYDGSKRLTTITDPYSKVTTFTYSGSYLQSIQDPANRLATFTHSGATLTAVQLPDNARVTYAYDGSGRMTTLTDANSHVLVAAYDAANRVGTITRADATSETFTAVQERGFAASSSSGSPAAATLLAEAAATHTDPNSHATDLRPDWRGMGTIDQISDPDGYIATRDRDDNGLATIAIDRLNRIDQYEYDNKGNVTRHIYPDLKLDAYAYNGFAQVTSYTDARSKTTTFAYSNDGFSDLIGIYQPDPGYGQAKPITQYTYTGTHRVQAVSDANSKVTTYAYDNQDRVTTVTYPAIGGSSATTLLAYDAYGNVATVTDERGNSTTYAYDALNRTTGIKDALTNLTTYTYDSGGNQTLVEAPTPAGQTARTTTYAYDSMDRLTTQTAPLNAGSSAVTVYGYDSGGNLKTVTDPLSRITTLAHDAEDRPTVITTPLTGGTNRVATTTYDAEGQVLTQVEPPLAGGANRITSYTYNSRGWATTITDPFGNTATLTYSATGQMLVESNPSGGGSGSGGSGNMSSYTYDDLDRRVAVADALGHVTTTLYDAKDNVTTVTDALSHSTTYAYDARDRLTTITDALGHATVYGYDSGGNRVTARDANSNTATTQYDALNRATTLTDARTAQTILTYDEAGRLTVVKDPMNNLTTFGYDAGDRRTTMTIPTATNGTASTTYAYDADGELTDTTDRDGRRVTYAYDSGGRRTGETWVGASGLFTLSYDPDGHLLTAIDANATLTYTYNSGGWMTSEATSGPGTGQPSLTLTSGYDAAGSRTSLADNLSGVGGAGQGLTTFTYDNAHRLTTIQRSLGGVAGPRVDYAYDNADRVTTLARTIGGTGTEVDSVFAYDNANRLTTLIHKVSGGSTLATYVYGYDSGNRLTSESDTAGTYTYNATYTYDAFSQLTGVASTNAETYTYDSGGNRTMTGYGTGGYNALTSSPGYTYTYDAEGNLTEQTQTSGGTQVTSYAYDYRNRMTGVTIRASSGGAIVHQVTYTYDAVGRRIGIELDGSQTWSVYDGQNTYGDFNSSEAVQVRYLYGPAIDDILARTDSGGTSAWYLTDHLGSVRDIVNTSGSVIDHVAYDAYGNILSESNAGNGDRFKYTGRELDSAIGHYDNRARYYDATVGRFKSEDPIGFSGNDAHLYRYVGNCPTGYTDRDGLTEQAGSGGSPTTTQQQQQRDQLILEAKKILKGIPLNDESTSAKEAMAIALSEKNYMWINSPDSSFGAHYDYRTGSTYLNEAGNFNAQQLAYLLAHEASHKNSYGILNYNLSTQKTLEAEYKAYMITRQIYTKIQKAYPNMRFELCENIYGINTTTVAGYGEYCKQINKYYMEEWARQRQRQRPPLRPRPQNP